jgi:hypothetical protein
MRPANFTLIAGHVFVGYKLLKNHATRKEFPNHLKYGSFF